MNPILFLLDTVNCFVPKILISGAHKNACEEQLFFVCFQNRLYPTALQRPSYLLITQEVTYLQEQFDLA